MNRILFALTLSFLLTACGGNEADSSGSTEVPSAPPSVYADAQQALESGEPAAKVAGLLIDNFSKVSDQQTGIPIPQNSRDFVEVAVALSDRYPTDTIAAAPLYRAAEVARSTNEAQRAATIYRTLYDRYPTFSNAPEALFMLAFTYDENLRDYDRARAVYEEFLEKHPDHFFAKDAPLMIKNLGKTSEELLKELEQQGQ